MRVDNLSMLAKEIFARIRSGREAIFGDMGFEAYNIAAAGCAVIRWMPTGEQHGWLYPSGIAILNSADRATKSLLVKIEAELAAAVA